MRILDELGKEFERVASGAPRRRGVRRRTVALSLFAAGTMAAGAVAASGVLSGEPVADPPGMKQAPTEGVGANERGSATLTSLRAEDPAGGPPWGLRTLRTTRGFGCVQLGRIVDGRLGVIGTDGAFGNDGKFHEKRPDLLSERECRVLDGAGRLFLSMSANGMPASGDPRACVVQRPPAPPPGVKIPKDERPLCPREDLRVVYYGTLGPQGRAVTYLDDAGRVATTRAVGPDGAYLVVLRPKPGRRVQGGFSPGVAPGSGLRSVLYRNGAICRIRSPERLGGAKRCPLIGYTRPRVPKLSAADVRSLVRARVDPRPVEPDVPGAPSGLPKQWEVTLTFESRVRGDALSYYTYTAKLDAKNCRFGSMGGPVSRDVRAGERVTVTLYVPAKCSGTVSGTVGFHQPGEEPDPMPYGAPGGPDLLVGQWQARLPDGAD